MTKALTFAQPVWLTKGFHLSPTIQEAFTSTHCPVLRHVLGKRGPGKIEGTHSRPRGTANAGTKADRKEWWVRGVQVNRDPWVLRGGPRRKRDAAGDPTSPKAKQRRHLVSISRIRKLRLTERNDCLMLPSQAVARPAFRYSLPFTIGNTGAEGGKESEPDTGDSCEQFSGW